MGNNNTNNNAKLEDNKPAQTSAQEGGDGNKKKVAKRNIVHPIRDVLGKDDNVNFAKNVIDTDITDKWAFDAYPLQLVLDLGQPPKEIDYIRIASENEQPVNIDFSNDNTATGYKGQKQQKQLKRGLNDLDVGQDVVARYIRLEFTGNKKEDKNKDEKPDPIGIYYVIVGQGEKAKGTLPVPGPDLPPQPTEEPPRPTEGRIKVNNDTNVKGWGADYDYGAANWKVVQMKQNNRFYKVVNKNGVNVADMFHTPENAETFITWYKWKQGPNAEKEGEDTTDPDPEPGGGGGGGGTDPGPVNPPPTGGSGTTKDGVKLLFSDGKEIVEGFKENFRDDGKRFDNNVGNWVASEAQGYFRFKSDPVDDEVSIKWSEKSHSGSAEVQCYDTGVKIKTGASRMRFENPHPEYSSNIGGGQGSPLGTKWVGYKGVKIPQKDGSVLIELYQDIGDNETKPSNQWKKVYSHVDTKYKRTGAHPYVTIRIDDPGKNGLKNIEWKWISVAKIA